MKKFKRYFKYWWTKSKMHFQVYFAYKLEWLGYLSTWIMGLLISIFFYKIIFLNINTLKGWRFEDMLLLYGVDMFIWGVFMTIFFDSLYDEFRDSVRWGRIDTKLIQPVNPRISLSLGSIDVPGFFNIMVSVLFIIIVLSSYNFTISIEGFFLSIVLAINGVLVLYNFLFFIYTIQFFALDFQSGENIFWDLKDVSNKPTNIFPKVIQIIIFTFLPAGIVAFIPFEAFIGKISLSSCLIAVIVNLLFLVGTQILFKNGLKKYSGVSS